MGAKSQLVRDNPNLSAEELVKLAQGQGMVLTRGYVYNIRANEKKRGGAPNGKAPVGRPPAGKRSNGHGSDDMRLEKDLRGLVIRLGLHRTERVISDLKVTLGA